MQKWCICICILYIYIYYIDISTPKKKGTIVICFRFRFYCSIGGYSHMSFPVVLQSQRSGGAPCQRKLQRWPWHSNSGGIPAVAEFPIAISHGQDVLIFICIYIYLSLSYIYIYISLYLYIIYTSISILFSLQNFHGLQASQVRLTFVALSYSMFFCNSRRCGYGLKLVPSSNPRGFLGKICRKSEKTHWGIDSAVVEIVPWSHASNNKTNYPLVI